MFQVWLGNDGDLLKLILLYHVVEEGAGREIPTLSMVATQTVPAAQMASESSEWRVASLMRAAAGRGIRRNNVHTQQ